MAMQQVNPSMSLAQAGNTRTRESVSSVSQSGPKYVCQSALPAQAEIQQHYGKGDTANTTHAADESRASTGTFAATGSTGGTGNTLLHALKSRTKERPAVMTLKMIHAVEGEESGEEAVLTEEQLLSGSGGWLHAA
jgi:hypothetical protein